MRRARAALGGLDLAVLRRRGGLQIGEQVHRRVGDGLEFLRAEPEALRPGTHGVLEPADGEPLLGINRLLRALGPDSVGRQVTLGLRRGGDPFEVQLTIGERPSA